MNNDQRRAAYLHDRSALTPRQAQRVKKHDHDDLATVSRVEMRKAHRALRSAARTQQANVRAFFALLRSAR